MEAPLQSAKSPLNAGSGPDVSSLVPLLGVCVPPQEWDHQE